LGTHPRHYPIEGGKGTGGQYWRDETMDGRNSEEFFLNAQQ